MTFTADVLEENCHQIGSMYLDMMDNTSDFDYACTEQVWQKIKKQLPEHDHAHGDYGKKEVYTIPDRYGEGKFQILVCKTDQELAVVLADNKLVKDYLDNLPREILVKVKDLKSKGKKWTNTVWKNLDEVNKRRWSDEKTIGPGTVWFKAILRWLQVIDGIKTLIASGDSSVHMELIVGYNSIFENPAIDNTSEYHYNFEQSLKDTIFLLMNWEFTLAVRTGVNVVVHIDTVCKKTRREERLSYSLYTADVNKAIGEVVAIIKTCKWDSKKNQMSVDITGIDFNIDNENQII